MVVVACSSPQQPVVEVERCRPCPIADAGVPKDARPILVDARGPVDAQDAGSLPTPDASTPPIDAGIIIPPTGHPRIMLGSQGARLRAALAAPTPAAARWRAAVNSWLGGADLWGFDAWNGALLSQLTGDARYCVKAVSNIDAQVAAAESKIAGGSNPEVAGDSYLGIGEMIGDLALVLDWCAPSDGQRTRWVTYANQAVWNVWHHDAAKWGSRLAPWTGWSVDNPSNNYYYSFLRATMLLGLSTQDENPQAATWIAMFRSKIASQLVPTFTRDLTGGGSREGTGYGVAMRNLFELYALWQWSTGERIADLTPHTRASLGTLLAGIVPTLDRFAPTGDQSRDSTASLFDYHRAYLLELIALYPDDAVSARAVTLLAASSVPQMANSFMLSYDFVYAPVTAGRVADLPLVTYAPGIGEIYARTRWDMAPQTRGQPRGALPRQVGRPPCNREAADCRWPVAASQRRGAPSRRVSSGATWMSLIAGPYTESHAHQDQGSLMLYRGGWLITDSVIWSHSGLPQTSDAHSLVRIDGVSQRNAETAGRVLALHVGPGYVFASVDTTGAYAGAVQLVRRQVLWLGADAVLVQDHVISAAPQTWQLVVPAAPVIAGDVATVTSAGHVLRVSRAGATWTVRALAGGDFSGGYVLEQHMPAGDRTYATTLTVDSTVAVPAVTWADVGVSWGGVTLGAGVDSL